MNIKKKVYFSLMIVFCIVFTTACSAPDASAKNCHRELHYGVPSVIKGN